MRCGANALLWKKAHVGTVPTETALLKNLYRTSNFGDAIKSMSLIAKPEHCAPGLLFVQPINIHETR